MLHYFAHAWRKQTSQSITNLACASVHHGFRGEEADADLHLVSQECHRLRIPFHAIYLDPQELQGSGGFEGRAREARYRELQILRKKLGLDFICTAHFLEDQAETILLRMMRGTGLLGLRGIHPERADGIWRPFLQLSSYELTQYAAEHKVIWREDPSNRSFLYARNRVRHLLLPHLRTEIQNIDRRLNALSQKAIQILEIIRNLNPQSIPKGSELQRLWLGMHGKLLDQAKLRRHNAPKVQPIVQKIDQQVLLNRQDGFVVWGANLYLLTWQFRDRNPSNDQNGIDADNLPDSLLLRVRQDGDRFSPPRLRCRHRKLKKFLQEQGVASFDRDCVPVLAFADEVLWVAGFGASGNYRVQETTRTVLEIQLRMIPHEVE
jgi:tRNA(Ile)-lysidine synthetase-like protein